MNKVATVLLMAWLGVSGVKASQGPLLQLILSAEVIVAGTLESGSLLDGRLAGALRVDRVLSGNPRLSGSIPVTAEIRGRIVAPGASVPAMRGLWFLTGNEAEGWQVLPGPNSLPSRYYPVAIELGSYAYSDSDPITDKVLLELCAGLESVDVQTMEFGMLAIALRGANGLDSPRIRSAFERLADSTEPAISALGLGGLLGLDVDEDTIKRVEERLPALAATPGFHLIVANMEDVTNSDPAVVDSLGRLATASTSSFELKRSAASALRSIHSQQAIPFLARLLDDQSPEIQSLGIAGLSAFVENLPLITPDSLSSMSWMRPQGDRRFGDAAGAAGFIRVSGQFTGQGERQAHVQVWKQWWNLVEPQLSGK